MQGLSKKNWILSSTCPFTTSASRLAKSNGNVKSTPSAEIMLTFIKSLHFSPSCQSLQRYLISYSSRQPVENNQYTPILSQFASQILWEAKWKNTASLESAHLSLSLSLYLYLCALRRRRGWRNSAETEKERKSTFSDNKWIQFRRNWLRQYRHESLTSYETGNCIWQAIWWKSSYCSQGANVHVAGEIGILLQTGIVVWTT